MIDRPASLDRVIDDVARSMSGSETPALRERVVANLGRQRRRSTGLLVPAAVLASAAAVAIAVHWTPSRAFRESASGNRTPTTTVARADVPAIPAAPKAGMASAPVQKAPRKTTPASADAEPDDAPSIDALPAIAAMPVSEIQPKPLGVAQLTVEHVANVAPLSVAALDEINRDR